MRTAGTEKRRNVEINPEAGAGRYYRTGIRSWEGEIQIYKRNIDSFNDEFIGINIDIYLSAVYYKIKLRDLGYRVVYQLITDGEIMRIIVISIRDDEAVYREAERRIRGLVIPIE